MKRAFNILVNTDGHDAARRAIAKKIGGEGSHEKAISLIEAIKRRHPNISSLFHSDAGIRLQRRDADMVEKIMRRLGSHGIVVLPIHDSFIAAARHEGALKDAMDIVWTQFIGGDQQVFPIGYYKNDPQMERSSGGEVRRPRLVLAPPVGRDLDLFGGRPRPVAALAGWSSGLAPPAVRSYLRDEIRARGLRQSDVAQRLGISRPQLVNILRGRFGASPRLALGINAFVNDLATPCDA